MKQYSDFMNEISSSDIYEGLLSFGLFSEKLPPIFSSEEFYNYCKNNNPSFPNKWTPHIHYDSMRNINVPRELGIPNPMAYQQLCQCISDHWSELQFHFYDKTKNEKHTVSRIHIRKMKDTHMLFRMNYKNWKTDGTPESDLLLGSQYIVHADISTCFPSIYTHSIPWAIIGKATAKTKTGPKWKNEWYNQIDHFSQNCKNGETHGILIGPHASNVLSEIILTAVDSNLSSKWKYYRNIDDYTCFVESREKAQIFLVELTEELRKFDLSLNHKKTEIVELPVAMTEQWERQICNPKIYYRNGVLDYIGVRSYLDNAIEVMQKNKTNSAILNYAIKALPDKDLTANAKEYCVNTIMHLCLLYPYLLQIIDEYVLVRLNVHVKRICAFVQMVYDQELRNKNYDGVCFALFLSLKYKFIINNISAIDAKNSDSCLFRLLAFLYFKKHSIKSERAILRDLAIDLKKDKEDFGRNWLFVYEALPQSDLPSDWKKLKAAGVSFIKKEFQA